MLPLLQTVLTTTAESLNDFAGQAGWTQALFATLFDPAWNQDNAHVIWPAVLFVLVLTGIGLPTPEDIWLTLAGFSEAFLVLRAQDLGLGLGLIPLVFIVMNVVYAFSAYPAGLISDEFGRGAPIVCGFLTIIAADIVLAAATGLWAVMAGVALWGLYMGLTSGELAALVADTAPARLRGTAFGIFNLVGGVAMLLASVLAGWLWDSYGAPAPFVASALMASVALVCWSARGLWLKRGTTLSH